MVRRIILLAGAMLFAGEVQAATIINGSFETGAYTEGYPGIVAGASDIVGWTVGLGGVNWGGNQMWATTDGTHSIDMSRSSPGSLSQTFATNAGQSYVVSFDFAGNPGGGGSRSMSVDVGAGTEQTYTFDTTGHTIASMGWTTQSYAFTAASSATTLTFTGLTPGASGAALDNVSIADANVAAVPETGSWMMMVGGFGLVGAAMRRRRATLFG